MKRHNDLPISSILKQWSESDKLKPKLIQKKLEANWELWFGKMVAKYTDKIFVRSHTVYIHLSSSVLRQELSQGKPQLLTNLNSKLGENYFEEVIIL